MFEHPEWQGVVSESQGKVSSIVNFSFSALHACVC